MANIAHSLRARLLAVAKEQSLPFQEVLNRFDAEQFLARLASSPHRDRFIFKGGSLLVYLIETERQTKDLDFSIQRVSNDAADAAALIAAILAIPLDDGLQWGAPAAEPLNHPEMLYPGVRVKCDFTLTTARDGSRPRRCGGCTANRPAEDSLPWATADR